MSVDSELKSIVSLFDDTDQIVVSAINNRMLSRGIGVIDDLSSIYDNTTSKKSREEIAERIIFLSNEFTIKELSEYVEEGEWDLWQGLYLISKLLLPELNQKSFDDQLFSMIELFSKEINEKQTAMEKVEIFNHIFYKRLLFKCRDYPFTRESTTVLLSVLNSRHGNPIIISILYFLFAQSVGLDLYPLCFTGGFVPTYIEGDKALFFVDVFRDGEIFFEDRLKNISDAQVRDDGILVIVYLEMLIFLYSSKEDSEMVKLLNRAISLFPDERFLETEEPDRE